MNKARLILVFLLSCLTSDALARDTTHYFSISDAMSSRDFKEKLNPNIQFYFGDQSYSKPISRIGEFITNKKTNAFGKSDNRACEWVLLSALITLQERALAEGGNAVVDIVSYYKRNVYSSEDKFECHAGAIMAGVALKGNVVKLP
ncbi:MAG: excinuclease ATPase subunit [Gammaproteobacteria bacterium]|nr:excinuclease ATPase subunit [Gammaproteobacteria bacterium]